MQTHHKYNGQRVTQYRAYGVETFCAHGPESVNTHLDVWFDGQVWRAATTGEKPFAVASSRDQLASAMRNASSQVSLRSARPAIHVAAAWLDGNEGELVLIGKAQPNPRPYSLAQKARAFLCPDTEQRERTGAQRKTLDTGDG